MPSASSSVTPTPIPDSGPSVLIFVGGGVGGFFVFIILCCAFKAMCCDSSEEKRKQQEALEKQKEKQKQDALLRAKLTKPKPTYEGPTYNNIPIVRADDDPNAKVLKRKQAEDGTLAGMITKNEDKVDHGTYRQRQELENEIIVNRKKQLDMAMAKEKIARLRDLGNDKIRFENETQGRDSSKNGLNRQAMEQFALDALTQSRTVKLPPPPRKNQIQAADSTPENAPRVKNNLARFKPQELPESWLKPSLKAGMNKATAFLPSKHNPRISHADLDGNPQLITRRTSYTDNDGTGQIPGHRRKSQSGSLGSQDGKEEVGRGDRRRQEKHDSPDSRTGSGNKVFNDGGGPFHIVLPDQSSGNMLFSHVNKDLHDRPVSNDISEYEMVANAQIHESNRRLPPVFNTQNVNEQTFSQNPKRKKKIVM